RRDVAALPERHAVDVLLGLRPPGALLLAAAVAPGRRFRLEPGRDDDAAVVGHAARAAEEADSTGPHLLVPAVGLAAQAAGICRRPRDHLDEHRPPPAPSSVEASQPGSVAPGPTPLRPPHRKPCPPSRRRSRPIRRSRGTAVVPPERR